MDLVSLQIELLYSIQLYLGRLSRRWIKMSSILTSGRAVGGRTYRVDIRALPLGKRSFCFNICLLFNYDHFLVQLTFKTLLSNSLKKSYVNNTHVEKNNMICYPY